MLWSTPSKSYFLTNRHVIEGASQVLLKLEALEKPGAPAALLKGRVYPRKSPNPGKDDTDYLLLDQDLAVLLVDVGRVPYVTLLGGLEAFNATKAGQAIGIAGFPSFRFEPPNNTADVRPSVHFGTINSLPYSSNQYIEYDAIADHGNSGGPMFDRSTGIVYGVVTLGIPSKTSKAVQNNLAINSINLTAYLYTLKLPSLQRSREEGTKADIPCVTYNPLRDASGLWWCSLPDAVMSR